MDLAKFAKWAIDHSFEGYDVDGGDMQNKAIECGILVEVLYDPKIHGMSEFDAAPGDPWYVFSDEFKASMPQPDSDIKKATGET